MNKYIVIYHAPDEVIAQMQDVTPEEMQKSMEPWMEWAAACGDGLVDMGTPLGGGLRLSTSGSAPSAQEVTGYSILQAENIAAAEAMLAGHPHMNYGVGCDIEVHEAMALPGQ